VTSGPRPTPSISRHLANPAPVLQHLQHARAAVERWWQHAAPHLLQAACGLVVVLALLAIISSRYRYRHGRGLAHAHQVLAVGGRRALRRNARYTRPGWSRPRWLPGAQFHQVGARIGRVGVLWPRWFGMSHEEALGVFAPQRQGKTRRLLARLVGDSPGTVVMASTKPDLLALTWRLLRGRQVHVLDIDAVLPPSDWTTTIRSAWRPWRQRTYQAMQAGWDPVIGCDDPTVAITRAEGFVGDGTQSDATNSRFFAGAAAQVLRCYFHAAALHGLTLDAVQRWAATRSDEPVQLLKNNPQAVPGWGSELATLMRGESAGDIFKQLGVALKVFADPKVVARACDVGQFDIDRFLRSGDALFVLASERNVNSAAYTTAFIAELMTRAQDLALEFPSRRHEPPLTVTIDELPGVATMPTFPQMLADSGGRGITIRWVAQGRSFLQSKWGEHGTTAILENTSWKIYLRGLTDGHYLAELEQLAGQRERKQRHGGGIRMVPILPQREIRVLRRNHALVIGTALHVFRCQLLDIRRDRTPAGRRGK
jgi:type IV secretion system protein VirD4